GPCGASRLRVVGGVPARPMSRPGAACVLVRGPVVCSCGDELVAGQDLVERALHRGCVARVAPLRVDAEADLELRAVPEQRLRVEIAERMAGPDRVLAQLGAAGADEDLRAARPL